MKLFGVVYQKLLTIFKAFALSILFTAIIVLTKNKKKFKKNNKK